MTEQILTVRFWMNWISGLMVMRVSGEGYCKNSSSALNYISTFLLNSECQQFHQYWHNLTITAHLNSLNTKYTTEYNYEHQGPILGQAHIVAGLNRLMGFQLTINFIYAFQFKIHKHNDCWFCQSICLHHNCYCYWGFVVILTFSVDNI